jgi:hypothetical protein
MTIHKHTEMAVFLAFDKHFTGHEIKVAGGEDSIQVTVFPKSEDTLDYHGAITYMHVIMDDNDPVQFLRVGHHMAVGTPNIVEVSIDAMMPPEEPPMNKVRDYLADEFARALNVDRKHHLIIVVYDEQSQFWVVNVQPYPTRVFGGGDVAYCGGEGDHAWIFTRIGPNLEYPTELKFARRQ